MAGTAGLGHRVGHSSGNNSVNKSRFTGILNYKKKSKNQKMRIDQEIRSIRMGDWHPEAAGGRCVFLVVVVEDYTLLALSIDRQIGI